MDMQQAEVALVPGEQHVTPTISVVICTRDRPDSIERALESVASQEVAEYDVLVVDQSQTGKTREAVERLMRRFPHVHYLHLQETGVARARNAGIRNTQGELVVFTDDDCSAPVTWLPTIQRIFTSHPETALLYGQVQLPPELQDQSIDGIIPVLWLAQRERLSRRDGFRVCGMTANSVVRRSMWERIGGFDELLGNGGVLKSGEDFDFAFRVFRAGGTILLEPDVVVYHYGLRSHSQWPATLISYGIGDGAFYLKHVRAGDLYAGILLARLLMLHTAREAVHSFQRCGAQWNYLRGVVNGIVHSLSYGVDRRKRLYYIRSSRQLSSQS